MVRPKEDRRKVKRKTRQKSSSVKYGKHCTPEGHEKVLKAIKSAKKKGVRKSSKQYSIPKTALQRKYNKVKDAEEGKMRDLLKSKKLVLLSSEEEDAVAEYVL